MKTLDSLTALEAIATRYSCRAFTNKLPSDEDLELIAKAAVAAPSGMNRQLWRVIVVKNKALLADLEAEGMKNLAAFPDRSAYERIMSRGGKLFYNAPCMIVVPIAGAQPAGAEMFDCGIVAENIALAATALGIDNLICGLTAFSFAGEKGAEFKKRLDFPEGYEIGIAVLLGYAKNPGGKPHEPDLNKITWIE
jgi:nitroreductase